MTNEDLRLVFHDSDIRVPERVSLERDQGQTILTKGDTEGRTRAIEEKVSDSGKKGVKFVDIGDSLERTRHRRTGGLRVKEGSVGGSCPKVAEGTLYGPGRHRFRYLFNQHEKPNT